MSMLKRGQILDDVFYLASSNEITTLSSIDKSFFIITGSLTQIIKLPIATNLKKNRIYRFYNKTTSVTNIIIQNSSGVAIDAVMSGQLLELILTDISTANGTWLAIYRSDYIGQITYSPVTPGTNYLECTGVNISRTTYAALFARIGTIFGAGDGSTTFTLPDGLGRSIGHAGNGSGLTARTLGLKTGAETVSLAVPNLPAHNHGVTDPGHGHSLSNSVSGNTGNTNDNAANVTAVNRYGLIQTVTALSNATGISTQNTGSGTAFSIMQPVSYMGKLFIRAL